MSIMQAHVTLDDDEPERTIAWVHPASMSAAVKVLNADPHSPEGRSQLMWLRLPNGDLMLGVFPQGDTYLDCEADAQYPAAAT